MTKSTNVTKQVSLSPSEIRAAFVTGFREGMIEFWSPFVGLARALQCSWRARKGPPSGAPYKSR